MRATPTKILLDESELPTQWYNVIADLPAPPDNVDPDLRAKLRAAIENLPAGSRASVILHDIEGYTHAEIGEMLGIAEGTSKARLFDARNRLKKALAAYAPNK